jgi:hypothetical protein
MKTEDIEIKIPDEMVQLTAGLLSTIPVKPSEQHPEAMLEVARGALQIALTVENIVKVVESLGGEIVREKTIDFKDDQGGWEWDVLDYEPNKGNAHKGYLVLELPEEYDRVVPW